MQTSFRYKHGGKQFNVVFLIKGPDGREYVAQKPIKDDKWLTFVFPDHFLVSSPPKPGRYTRRVIIDCFDQGVWDSFNYDPSAIKLPVIQGVPALGSPPAQGETAKGTDVPNSTPSQISGGSVSGTFQQFAGANSLYPLQPGRRWVYRSSSAALGSTRTVVTNLARRQIMGRTVTPQSTDSGTISFVAEDSTGIYEVARQTPTDMGPVSRTPGFVVKYPIRVGASYTNRGELILLPALATALGGSGRSPELNVTATIESVDEIVTVPAGTFNRCVKVKEVGTIRLKNRNVHVENHTWLAPGVGMVRAIIREWADREPGDLAALSWWPERFELTMDLESVSN